MIRTQVQLTEEQHRGLKRWAGRLGISMAEAVRRCVDDRLRTERDGGGRDQDVADALSVLGRYSDPDGASRTGRDHDEHLVDVFRR